MADKAERKQVPMRVSKANWKVLQLAKLNSGQSLQRILFRAVDTYLRENKLGKLAPQEDPE